MLKLINNEIIAFKKTMKKYKTQLFEYFESLEIMTETIVKIKNKDFGFILSIGDRKYNITVLSKFIFKYFEGDKEKFKIDYLKTFSPFQDIQEELKKEIPSKKSIVKWLNN